MRTIFTLFCFSIILLFACVPAKQFQELQTKYQKCQEETAILKTDNEDLTIKSTELASQIDVLSNEVLQLLEDTSVKAMEIKEIKKNLDKISQQYKDLQVAQDQLLKGNADETKRLLQQLQATQTDLQIREDRLREISDSLKIERMELDKLQNELAERNKRLVELESILFKKDSIVGALKDKISKALLGFENNGLTITRREGKVYVSLEEKLLFQSGSAEVDQNGITALKKLAKVLEENPEINIMIEGHTDDVPYIPDEAIKDNWDLSVRRATTIVRILLKNSKIDPKRLTAAGRGEFMPVDPLKTDDARRKNRRTEIILAPDLSELFDIIE
ncbi:MAG: OmpA family protein [Bacteroidales bacterium]|nr:OmpA family protein [Bacteroidales bacterium]